jgi:BASS family bile acid:Na+ symporter
VSLTINVGLVSTLHELVYVLRRPALLLRALVAICAIPATAAVVVALVLPLEPAVRAGIVLMGLTPVQPIVPGKLLGIAARKELAHGIYIAMSVLAIVVMPVVFDITAHIVNRDDHIGFALIAEKIVKGVLVPLVAGLLVRRFWPAFAERIAPWLKKLGLALLVLAFAGIALLHLPVMLAMLGNGTLLAMLLVIAASLAGGHLLAGPERDSRVTLAIAAAARHPGLALMISVGSSFYNDSIAPAIVLYTLTGIAVEAVYAHWLVRVPAPA